MLRACLRNIVFYLFWWKIGEEHVQFLKIAIGHQSRMCYRMTRVLKPQNKLNSLYAIILLIHLCIQKKKTFITWKQKIKSG